MKDPDITLDSFGIAGDWQKDLQWSDSEPSLREQRDGPSNVGCALYEAEEYGRGRGIHECKEALRSGEEWLARLREQIGRTP